MLGALARDGEPVELARKADGEVGNVDHLLHFAFAFGQDLAHFERDERAEIVFETAQLVADFAHDLAALGGREHAPALENVDAFDNGVLVIFGGGEADASEFAAIGGVERSDGAGENRRKQCPGVPERNATLLCQPSKSLRSRCEFTSGLAHGSANAFDHVALKLRLQPRRMPLLSG